MKTATLPVVKKGCHVYDKLKYQKEGRVKLPKIFNGLSLDAREMDLRLKRKLSPAEFFGILFTAAFLGIFIWLIHIQQGYPGDFAIYLAGKDAPNFYYGYWILPLFQLLKLLPFDAAYGIWGLLNILAVFFAVRVFNGKAILVLASYQLISSLFYGQIGGLITGGLAICWFGLVHKKWYIAGLGLILAVTKFQVGLTLGLLLIWYSGARWRDFLSILILPALIGLISIFLYPIWPIDVLMKISQFPYIHLGITFWYFIGAWSLLFWIPALLLPLSRPQRFIALFSLSIFAVPYFLQFDLLILFSLPIGWLPLGGYIGLLFPFFGMTPIRAIVLIPFILYLSAIVPPGLEMIKNLTANLKKAPGNSG